VGGAALKTYVTIVLDKSGSMNEIREETRTGLNEQIQALRDEASQDSGEIFVSLIEFNHHIDPVFLDKNAKDLVEVTDYKPCGTTALFDAIDYAIKNTPTIPEMEAEDSAALVIVLTDGIENASQQVKSRKQKSALATQVKLLQDTGRWTFSFMGANIDIETLAQQFSIPAGNSISWNTANADSAWKTLRGATSYFVGQRSNAVYSTQRFFDKDSTS